MQLNTITFLIRHYRKRWIQKRIELAIHDQKFYERQAVGAIEAMHEAERTEAKFRSQLFELDYPPLPRGLTT